MVCPQEKQLAEMKPTKRGFPTEQRIYGYEKCGYKEIEKPAGVVHATMNRFFIKELSFY